MNDHVQAFVRALGWGAARRRVEVLENVGEIPWWEARVADDVFLQVNVYRGGSFACVYAIRFGVVSGWMPVELETNGRALAEADRLRTRLGREHFEEQHIEGYVRSFPEAGGWTWARLQDLPTPADL